MKPLHVTLISSLIASTLLAQAPSLSRIAEEAQGAYKRSEFQKAYGFFETLSNENPESAEYNFFLGRSALELKMYDEALTAFDRVLMLNPSHTRTRLELARLYYETKQYEHAQVELDLVLKENIPQTIRDVAMAFKTRINEHQSKHRFGGALIVGGGYDTNANNDIGKKEFIVPAFNVPITGNDKVSDSNLFATLLVNHTYDFGEKGGWSLENSFIVYDKLNTKQSQNDLVLFSLSSAPKWSAQSYNFSFPLGYDRVYLDGKGYMYNLSATAKASYLIDATAQLESGYTFKQGFYDEDEAQDVFSHTFFVRAQKAFGTEAPIILSLTGSYSQNAEVNEGRTDVESSGYSYALELSKSFKNGLRTSLGYTGSKTDFEEMDVLFGSVRNDTRSEFEWTVGYQWTPRFSINLSASYIENSSNHDPFNYDKITGILSALYAF